MNSIEVACPACAALFSLNADELSPPPGTVVQLVCKTCKHKGPLHHFEKALRAIQRANDRAIEEKMRRDADSRDAARRVEATEKRRAEAAADEENRILTEEMDAEASRLMRDEARRREVEQSRTTCPICENLCSSKAKACPRCGQPICADPLDSELPMLKAPIPWREIMILRLFGVVYIALGFISLLCIKEIGVVLGLAGCIGGVASGVTLRALAGIWRACEVAARR